MYRKDLSELLIVDLESTCVENKSENPNFVNEIIEIGICRLNLKTLTITDAEGILVIPQKSILTPFCTKLTSITEDMIKEKGLTYFEAVNYIDKKYRPRNKGWASWGDYDRKQFQRNDRLYNNPYPLFSENHTNLKYQFSILNGFDREFGMEKALQICKLPLKGTHHRGFYDSINNASIWTDILRKVRRQ